MNPYVTVAIAASVAMACGPVSPTTVTVLCDQPSGDCSDARALTAFAGAISQPGSMLRLVWLGPDGLTTDTSICAPARYQTGAMRGPQLIAEVAVALLSDARPAVNSDRCVDTDDQAATCRHPVPLEFACASTAATAEVVPITVGPIGELAPFASASQSPTTYVVVCDQSESTGTRSCETDLALQDVFQRFVRDGAPLDSRIVVVPTRENYGSTLDMYGAALGSHPDLASRIANAHRELATARRWLTDNPGTGSAVLEAIAVGVATAKQSGAGRIVLVPWSDGRETSGRVNLARDLDERELEQLAILAGDVLPSGSLVGTSVHWRGLHGRGTTPVMHRALRSALTEILTNAGASEVVFEDLVPNPDTR